jgi:hypothetical protein
LKKLVLINDNLTRVNQQIKTWNLKLNTSERYLSNATDEEEDGLQPEDADSSEADEPEDSMMYYEGKADD